MRGYHTRKSEDLVVEHSRNLRDIYNGLPIRMVTEVVLIIFSLLGLNV